MKARLILFVLFLSEILVLYSLNIVQSNTGPHGGEFKQVENFNIEMKSSFPNFYFYLLDQKLKPINNYGISCEVRFFLPDETSTELTLKRFQQDGFMIEAGEIIYNSCRVTFNVFGKLVSAKFEKENFMVRKKYPNNKSGN